MGTQIEKTVRVPKCKLAGAAIDNTPDAKSPAETDKSNVRFAAQDEQIEPTTDLAEYEDKGPEDLPPEAREQIKTLAMTLQKSRLQESRMSNFAYEPVSMPASRVSSARKLTLRIS